MPIHDLGYRGWPGKQTAHWMRFWAIASNGIRIVSRNKWVRRVLMLAWLPVLYWAAAFFAYERFLEDRELLAPTDAVNNAAMSSLAQGLEEILGTAEVEYVTRAINADDEGESRHMMWIWLLSGFLRLPQAVWVLLVVGLIAPPLIARDVRSKAFLLYFSRPINRYEYVLGKVTIVSFYVALITTAPALGCYFFGLSLSSEMTVILETWDIPLRIIVASLVFIVPAVSVALMFSSLTAESRFAAFAWFACWGLGFVAWKVTYGVMSGAIVDDVYMEVNREERQRERLSRQQLSEMRGGPSALPSGGEVSEPGGSREQTTLAEGPAGPATWPTPGMDDSETIIIVDGQVIDLGSVEQRRNAERYVAIREKVRERRLRFANNGLSLVSMYDTLIRVQRWVFGLEPKFINVLPSIIVTVLVTLFSWGVLLRRVSAPIRV